MQIRTGGIAESVKKKLFIVGNGPLPFDMSERIDASDHVVRFNQLKKPSAGMSGTKTDWLFVCNTGNPMRRRLRDPGYPASSIVRNADLVFLVYHPQIVKKYFIKPNFLSRLSGKRSDWTQATLTVLGRAGKTVALLPPAYYEEGCAELGLPASLLTSVFPSTGYFGIRYTLEHLPATEWDVEIAGFSWQGWKRHAWADEREWVARKVRERNIRLWLAKDENVESNEKDREIG